MADAWFVAPYRVKVRHNGLRVRYCGMDDHSDAIRRDGGEWAETEILGGLAVVRVWGVTDAVLDGIASDGFDRLPDDIEAVPTRSELAGLRRIARDAGYSPAEIAAAGNRPTVRRLLELLTTRRRPVDVDGRLIPGRADVRPAGVETLKRKAYRRGE